MLKKTRGVDIKTFLTDPKKVLGIGNAYVDEILYAARIAPMSASSALPPEAIDKLYDAISEVLNWAIEELFRRTPDAIAGETRDFLRVHNPKLKYTPEGEAILTERSARGGKTYYTGSQKFHM